ncbi:MAG: 6-phosphogluconolactonase [Nitrospirae bacterium]|nr:6-phosphogluconolactonase [Nitrospirota bacterium]
MPPTTPSIRVSPTSKELIQSVADEIVLQANTILQNQSMFTMALAGGSTPRDLYSLLALPSFQDQVPWKQIKVFWGDERHVPPDHQESNYRMAQETLLSHIPLPPSHVFRISGEEKDANQAAQQYEKILQQELASSTHSIPRFDLILLGMGPDGHTASLFPGTAAVHEKTRLVMAPWVEKFQTFRITLTPPILNQASQVMFLVSGANKAEILQSVLEGPFIPDQFPSQMIRPTTGSLTWFIDQAAAQKLSSALPSS